MSATPDATETTPEHRLVVYGTLAPGRPNEHVLADVPGTWSRGWVEGDLYEHGWGAAEGYPAMRWRPGGPRIEVYLFESAELPRHWARLDGFEGEGYERVPIDVFNEDGGSVTGYIYAARMPAEK